MYGFFNHHNIIFVNQSLTFSTSVNWMAKLFDRFCISAPISIPITLFLRKDFWGSSCWEGSMSINSYSKVAKRNSSKNVSIMILPEPFQEKAQLQLRSYFLSLPWHWPHWGFAPNKRNLSSHHSPGQSTKLNKFGEYVYKTWTETICKFTIIISNTHVFLWHTLGSPLSVKPMLMLEGFCVESLVMTPLISPAVMPAVGELPIIFPREVRLFMNCLQ